MTSAYIEQFKQLLDPAPGRFAVLETPRGLVVMRWVVGAVFVFGLLGCVTKGANNPKDPFLAPTGASAASATASATASTGSGGRTLLGGFGETKVTVQTADGLLTWCLLLAATPAQRERGLMEVTDPALGGYDGMLFRYDSDAQERYWMFNTPMPLSIAWVDVNGHIVATADMAPCGTDNTKCPSYPADGKPPPYRAAIEVPQGKLPDLGMVPGSTITDTKTACT